MVAPGGNEEVRYDILIEAKAAIKTIQDLIRSTDSMQEKIIGFTNIVQRQAKQWGVSWQYALNVYKQLNAELSKSKKATIFGNVGGQDMFKMSGNYLSALEQAGRLQEQVGKSAEQMGTKTETATKKMVRGLDLVRIALGAIVAMIVFRVIQAFQDVFREAIKQATQFEDTLYRLRNVERDLSLSGIEISMKGLQKGIKDIQKLLPIFSKEDVAQLVGTLAISTKQLGLNEQQILDLAKAIGVLNVRSEKQEELSVTAQHVLSSILTGNARGITSLGIAFTDNVMKAKAMELGFLKTGEALSSLSENEKGLTKLGIILESTGGELGSIGDYLDTNSAKLQQNNAAWKDLMTTLGQVLLPFIPALTSFFQLINDGFNGFKVILIEAGVRLAMFIELMRTAFTGDFANLAENIRATVERTREMLTNTFFKAVPENAPDWFKRGWGKLIKEEAETATSGINQFAESVSDFDAEEFGNKIEDIRTDMEQAQEDLAEKFGQKREDIDLEYQRKAIDAEKDYQRKIEDINRDAERDLAALKDKQRQEDLRAEKDYQNKLWELRMRFLMDLEDALHARDARQVIRLQKQYEIDKEALLRKKNLDDTQREEDQRNEREDIEIRRQQRIEDAKIEYQQKLDDQRTAKQRELDDLNEWYAREQADLQQNIQRKLEALIKGWIDEQKLTEQNAATVYGILLKYFGPGGLTDSVYAYMASQLSMASSLAPLAGQGGMTSSIPRTTTGGSTGGRPMPTSPRAPRSSIAMAEGGTLLASRPTNVTFGEAGPEMAQFTPLTHLGQSANRVFGSMGSNGVSGEIVVQLELSPDLEARVVNASMDGVANVITKISRTKQ